MGGLKVNEGTNATESATSSAPATAYPIHRAIAPTGTNVSKIRESEQKTWGAQIDSKLESSIITQIDSLKEKSPIDQDAFNKLCGTIEKLDWRERMALSKHTDALGNNIFSNLDASQKEQLVGVIWNKEMVKAISGVYGSLLNGTVKSGYSLDAAVMSITGDMTEKVWTFNSFCKGITYKNETVNLPTWNEFFPGIGKPGFGNGLSPAKAADGSIDLKINPPAASPWINN